MDRNPRPSFLPLHNKHHQKLYVERPLVEHHLKQEIKRAERSDRPFLWCFTGHTGSGKSTELNRLLNDPIVKERHLPIPIDLKEVFNIPDIKYTDLILAMAKGCVQLAENERIKIPDPLQKAIENWGAKIFSEEEVSKRTEGRAGIKASLMFFAAQEEIRSGGSKREVIHKEISTNIIEFIKTVDELAKELNKATGRKALCVLDGLDHMDLEPCEDLFTQHFNTIGKPNISKIFVIPLALLNSPFITTIEGNFSTVPNIKVFNEPGSTDIDPEGFKFYKEVISRYISLKFFDADALESLFHLSAGVVRDMIRNTGDACLNAYEDKKKKVGNEDVEKVWNSTMRFYRSQLMKDDYEVLSRTDNEPFIKGIDGLPPLLQSKAVVFYPNGEGWYGVHPAVRRIIKK